MNFKKNKVVKYIGLILLAVLLAIIYVLYFQKKDEIPVNNKPNSNEKVITIDVPIFNSDSAYIFIDKQVSFGPRFTSSKGWRKCAIWLEKKLSNYADTIIVQSPTITTYDGKNHDIRNIIASFSPEKNNRIALFAHWDTRHIADQDSQNKTSPILGANDGGSGVGVLLEMARQFKIKKPKIGLDIILFDAEDYGQPEKSNFPKMEDSWCLGSQYWSKNPHRVNYNARYGILLDMVGAKNATFYMEGYSMHFAPAIVEKVWKKAATSGFNNYFIYEKSPEIIDDHFYVNYLANIPTIDIIEYDPSTKNRFNKHWHTHGDDMQNINQSTLNSVGQTLLDLIYNE